MDMIDLGHALVVVGALVVAFGIWRTWKDLRDGPGY